MKTRHRPQQLSFDGHCEGYLPTRGEIKKLQRHRDFFKQLIKDGEIKDKTKM